MAVEACTVAMLAVAHEPDMRGSVLTFDAPQRGTVLPAHLLQSSEADRVEILLLPKLILLSAAAALSCLAALQGHHAV